MCDNCEPEKVDLFKVKDEVWCSAGFTPTEVVCLDCLEQAMNRKVALSDLDLSFPWWKAYRPEFYQGVEDGVKGECNSPHNSDGQYENGFKLGQRFAVDSA